MAAFPSSIDHYFERAPALSVVAEPFTLCLASEPDAFFVADSGGGAIAGYIFTPAHTGRIPWAAIRYGIAFRWLWRWLSGQYRIGLAPIRALAQNKLNFLVGAGAPAVKAKARILSVAVHPDHPGRGVASRLCALALARLDRLGASPVRLEVRPDNGPALAMYTRLGFRPCGEMRDSQGAWLIMLR
jgi:[ribosomal protein S18]-alanine N-acetyltransferase